MPDSESEDAVFGFTHSAEVNNICAGTLPYAITPVNKSELVEALDEYIRTHGIDTADEARIRAWLNQLPDEAAVIERKP